MKQAEEGDSLHLYRELFGSVNDDPIGKITTKQPGGCELLDGHEERSQFVVVTPVATTPLFVWIEIQTTKIHSLPADRIPWSACDEIPPQDLIVAPLPNDQPGCFSSGRLEFRRQCGLFGACGVEELVQRFVEPLRVGIALGVMPASGDGTERGT